MYNYQKIYDYQNIDKKALLASIVITALKTDGAHYKQWYLEQIAKLQDINLEDIDYEKGIIP